MDADRRRGQAAVEFLALVPAIALLVLVLLQVVLLSGSWLAAAGAARAAVRADEVGAPSDAAARAALPGRLAARARISGHDDRVTVTLRVPGVVPGLGTFRVEADARR